MILAFTTSVPLRIHAKPNRNNRLALCTVIPTASIGLPPKQPTEQQQSQSTSTPTQTPKAPVHITEAQWQDRLSPAAYVVLRHGRTEWPFTSPLLDEQRPGVFKCTACKQKLFDSRTKYSSGTGWPSFWRPFPDAVRLKANLLDRILGQREVSCAKCEGHLGHVFRDGPLPTGERYCINGIALEFTPKSE